MALAGRPTADQLVALFNQTFLATESTLLEGGAEEPFYLPGAPARIYFRSDYPRSALHEIAHWCVAGARRRQMADYGYWYSPDGRNAAGQSAFFAVEARPQALEALFCDACGIDFAPSVDNVECEVDSQLLTAFEQRIAHWRQTYERLGLPPRAERFAAVLRRAFEASALRGTEPAAFSAEQIAQ